MWLFIVLSIFFLRKILRLCFVFILLLKWLTNKRGYFKKYKARVLIFFSHIRIQCRNTNLSMLWHWLQTHTLSSFSYCSTHMSMPQHWDYCLNFSICVTFPSRGTEVFIFWPFSNSSIHAVTLSVPCCDTDLYGFSSYFMHWSSCHNIKDFMPRHRGFYFQSLFHASFLFQFFTNWFLNVF